MKNPIAIIPIITGGCALFAWWLVFVARSVIDRWIADGKKGHLHVAWQAMYDRFGRDGIVYGHLVFAIVMTLITAVGVWRVLTLRP